MTGVHMRPRGDRHAKMEEGYRETDRDCKNAATVQGAPRRAGNLSTERQGLSLPRACGGSRALDFRPAASRAGRQDVSVV